MDHANLRSGSYIDLESGGIITEENRSKSLSLSGETSKKLLKRVWSGFLGLESPDKTGIGRASLSLYDRLLNPDEITVKNVRRTDKLFEKMISFKEEQLAKKKSNSIKPAKPPRPPKGPSLNAADMKLVKEISELAMLKRKRIERMKALKKMKKEKASVLNSKFFAMVVTVLFFIVIIVQGLLGSHV